MAYLVAKYGDVALATKIMARDIWEGMTAAQLIDSSGRPVEIANKYYKSKITEIINIIRLVKIGLAPEFLSRMV